MTVTTQVRAFDFHCHVDLFRDPPRQIATYERQRIFVLAVTTTPRAWKQNAAWTANSEYVQAAAGLHPELVHERYDELAMLRALVARAPFIGEIGLDGTPEHRGTLEMQRRVFRSILQEANRLGQRVLSIHSRRAGAEVLTDIGEQTTQGRVIPILHWFSASRAAARRAAAMGCYFSVNGRTLGNERGVALVQTLPIDRILTETDAPLVSGSSESMAAADALSTVARLADARGMEPREMAVRVAANATRVCAFVGRDIRFKVIGT